MCFLTFCQQCQQLPVLVTKDLLLFVTFLSNVRQLVWWMIHLSENGYMSHQVLVGSYSQSEAVIHILVTHQRLIPFSALSSIVMQFCGQPSPWHISGCFGVAHLPSLTRQCLIQPGTSPCRMSPHTSKDSHLQHMDFHLKASKNDSFCKGVIVIIGYSCVHMYGTYTAWSLLQHHQAAGSKLLGLSFQHAGCLLTRKQFVSHLKVILYKLVINPTLYSDHSFRIGDLPQKSWPVLLTGN